MCSGTMVSVICNVYNHEKYIANALEGFVNQKTKFAFEVLIHDDASTDRSADIIEEYAEKYPDLIKPIYQTENQYSQNVNITTVYQMPRVTGKYIAFCEGDDYWTDPYKLQKQFDAMESHPELDICAHAVKRVDAKTGQERGSVSPSDKDCVFTTKQVIRGGGGFVGTASLFYRRELNQLPKFREMLHLDYTLQVHGALRGGMLYLHEPMGVYRVDTPGSWTSTMRNDLKRKRAHGKRIRAMLKQMNVDTRGKYASVICRMYLRSWLRNLYYIVMERLSGRHHEP